MAVAAHIKFRRAPSVRQKKHTHTHTYYLKENRRHGACYNMCPVVRLPHPPLQTTVERTRRIQPGKRLDTAKATKTRYATQTINMCPPATTCESRTHPLPTVFVFLSRPHYGKLRTWYLARADRQWHKLPATPSRPHGRSP